MSALGGVDSAGRESLRTWANAVTVSRTVVSVPLGLAAVLAASERLLLIGYLVYWIGDVADGALARSMGQETRIGAVLDITADRAACGVLAVGLGVVQPELLPALSVFLIQFMVLDSALSLSFLYWPHILGPNDFHLVDETIWRWNWSKPAKAVNTAAVVLAAAAELPVPALALALLQLAVKVVSARRLLVHVLPIPAFSAR